MISPESCDDGVFGDLNGCKNNCLGTYPGWKCEGGTPSSSSTCVPICGDGILIAEEECDDSNTAS